jgi:arsenate reductase (glutaredoxin)
MEVQNKSEIKFYHNPRCSKSRDALKLIVDNNIKHQVVFYLENNLTKEELTSLIKKLNITPAELLRKNETLYKEKYKDKKLTEQDYIKIMTENPKLIERPIIETKDNAFIGRPIEKVIAWLN